MTYANKARNRPERHRDTNAAGDEHIPCWLRYLGLPRSMQIPSSGELHMTRASHKSTTAMINGKQFRRTSVKHRGNLPQNWSL